MSKQFRCEACNCVESANPHTLCNHCNDEFYRLRQLATLFRQRFDFWHLDVHEVIRTGVNRLVAEINELRKRVK